MATRDKSNMATVNFIVEFDDKGNIESYGGEVVSDPPSNPLKRCPLFGNPDKCPSVSVSADLRWGKKGPEVENVLVKRLRRSGGRADDVPSTTRPGTDESRKSSH